MTAQKIKFSIEDFSVNVTKSDLLKLEAKFGENPLI